jgi:hypothetical protein
MKLPAHSVTEAVLRRREKVRTKKPSAIRARAPITRAMTSAPVNANPELDVEAPVVDGEAVCTMVTVSVLVTLPPPAAAPVPETELAPKMAEIGVPPLTARWGSVTDTLKVTQPLASAVAVPSDVPFTLKVTVVPGAKLHHVPAKVPPMVSVMEPVIGPG